jgi:hypothetical protein
MTTLEYFKTNKETIIEKTLEQIASALKGDKVNRSFFIKDENVTYSVYAGQIILDERYFFTIKDHETPDPGDYGYNTNDEMLQDDKFIEDYYKDQLEESIDTHILMMEYYS